MGITFNYPSNKVTAMNWLGQGPYRVYKNRLAGQEVFTHTKSFNYVWTGQSTNYVGHPRGGSTRRPRSGLIPKFQVFTDDSTGPLTDTLEQPITVVTPSTSLFFRLLTPPNTEIGNK